MNESKNTYIDILFTTIILRENMCSYYWHIYSYQLVIIYNPLDCIAIQSFDTEFFQFRTSTSV